MRVCDSGHRLQVWMGLRVLTCWWNKTRISSCILNMDVKRTTYLLNIRHSLWRRANARNVSFSVVTVANLHFQLSWYIQITLLPPPTQHHSFFRNFHPLMRTWEDVMIPRGQHDFFIGKFKDMCFVGVLLWKIQTIDMTRMWQNSK